VDVCGNGINAYAPGGANLSCDHLPTNFGATGCAPGSATYDGFGLSFQCVELIVRFSAWAFGDRPSAWQGDAPDLWLDGNHPSHFSAYPNGGSHSPVRGDILVWGAVDAQGRPWPAGPHDHHDGHVAVVAAVTGAKILIVEENTLWGATNVPSETITLTQSAGRWTLGNSNRLYGWLHSSKNTGHFTESGDVHGAVSPPSDLRPNSSNSLPSLAPGVAVTSMGTLADLAWSSVGDTTPRVRLRSLGTPGVELIPSQMPAALATPTGDRDTFVLGRDGQVYDAHTASTQMGVAWSRLGAPPGVMLSGSVAASALPEGIAVGAIGSDGNLWWRAGPAGYLGGWTAIGHPDQSTLQANPILAGTPGTGLPMALALGRDGNLYESNWLDASSAGVSSQEGWDGWAQVSIPGSANALTAPLLSLYELPADHAQIGTWPDVPLDLMMRDSNGKVWILRRTASSSAWHQLPIANVPPDRALLGGAVVPPPPDAPSTSATLLHMYLSDGHGVTLGSIALSQKGDRTSATWMRTSSSQSSSAPESPGAVIPLGQDLSMLLISTGRTLAIAGLSSALALVAAPAVAASGGSSTASHAPSAAGLAWRPLDAVPGADSFSDLFRSPPLDPRWLPIGDPGSLKVWADGGVALSPSALPDRTMLLQSAPNGDAWFTVQVALPSGSHGGTEAGVLLYFDDANWLALGLHDADYVSMCPVAWGRAFPCLTTNVWRGSPSGRQFLRLERQASTYTALMSADGSMWQRVGTWTAQWPDPSDVSALPPASPLPSASASWEPVSPPATGDDAASLPFTVVGVYAQDSSGGHTPAQSQAWPTFLSFDVSVPSAQQQ
jgi:CHAP domain